MKFRYIGIATVAATVLSLQAQDASLVQSALSNYAKDEAVRSDYAYTEEYQIKNLDRHGKVTSDHTSEYEAVMLEGVPYLRETEEEGPPPSGKRAEERCRSISRLLRNGRA